MLLTGAQVSMAISSGIVLLFTFLLFLSGYILQQQTVRGLQGAIRHHMPRPTAQLPANNPTAVVEGVKIIPGPKETFFARPIVKVEEPGSEGGSVKSEDEGEGEGDTLAAVAEANKEDKEEVVEHMLNSVEELRENKDEGGGNESEAGSRGKGPEVESVMDAAGERWAVKGEDGGPVADDRETNLYRRRMSALMDERRRGREQRKMDGI